MNSPTDFRVSTPDHNECCLFLGVVREEVLVSCDGRWIILIFDGKRVRRICFGYSHVWGIYIWDDKAEKEIGVAKRIRAEGKSEKLEIYAAFGSCPSLNINYNDWIDSAVESMKELIEMGLSRNSYGIIVLVDIAFWAGPQRIRDIYQKLGINRKQIADSVLVEDIVKKGSSILAKGNVSTHAFIDSDYYVLAIKADGEEFKIVKEILLHKGRKLALSIGKNTSSPRTVVPFAEDQEYMDLVFVKDDKQQTPVSIYRVRENKTSLYAQIEPVSDTPSLMLTNTDRWEKLEIPRKLPRVEIRENYRTLQIVVVVDGTMSENLLTSTKKVLTQMFRSIVQKRKKITIGLVVYGDYSESFQTCDYDVKPIPARFLDLQAWEQLCEDELKRIAPADFMSALDRGLDRANRFPWDEKGEKYMILALSKLPHPPVPYDFCRLSGNPPHESWVSLLEGMIKEKNIHLFSVSQPEDIKGPYVDAIKGEIKQFTRQLKTHGFIGEGLRSFGQVEIEVIKKSVVRFEITPSKYQLPRLLETES